MKSLLAIIAVCFSTQALAQGAPLIRLGRGFAAEENLWLMSARPDLTPNQGKRYELKQILFQANPERFQAFLAGEIDAGTAPGLAVIFARAQGLDMKIVASVSQEAAGKPPSVHRMPTLLGRPKGREPGAASLAVDLVRPSPLK